MLLLLLQLEMRAVVGSLARDTGVACSVRRDDRGRGLDKVHGLGVARVLHDRGECEMALCEVGGLLAAEPLGDVRGRARLDDESAWRGGRLMGHLGDGVEGLGRLVNGLQGRRLGQRGLLMVVVVMVAGVEAGHHGRRGGQGQRGISRPCRIMSGVCAAAGRRRRFGGRGGGR